MTSTEILTILRSVRTLLARRTAWTKYTSARDSNGDSVSVSSADAVCWCLGGALDRCGDSIVALGSVTNFLSARLGVLRIGEWNDTHAHVEMLAMLDETIAELEASP
jgi:hypothetical protein